MPNNQTEEDDYEFQNTERSDLKSIYKSDTDSSDFSHVKLPFNNQVLKSVSSYNTQINWYEAMTPIETNSSKFA